jgi:hypothetical protein
VEHVIALAFNVDGILIIENELNTFLASLHYANELKFLAIVASS